MADMKSTDAQFQIGDWFMPHKLSTSDVEGDHPDLAAVSCSCGWGVMTGKEMAKRLGKLHLNRAAEKAAQR